MFLKSKISGSEKIAAIEKYLCGEDSLNHLATLLDHKSIKMSCFRLSKFLPFSKLNFNL